MKNSTLLEKIKAMLSNEVKLEQMLMGDGVTKIEAESFEAGKEVFVVTEDEQKIAVPVGEYELEDGRILVIVEEGIISEVKEKEEEGTTYEEMTSLLKPLITEEKGKTVKIKPKIVVSVTYQEIQKSPNYSSGFALRFPRFTALRPDRSPSDITTLKEVEKDFEKQKRNYQYG